MMGMTRAGLKTAGLWRKLFSVATHQQKKEITMPRYLVERTFPQGLSIPMTEAGAKVCSTVVGANATLSG